jgi:hypothetical protein
MERNKVIDDAGIEGLVGQVRGVMAARVVRDAQGQIDELHVVGSPVRSAKQMVRDVESILYVRGGIRIDHRKISLVQIAETAIQPTVVRVRLLDVEYGADGQGAVVGVTLAVGEQRVKGISRGVADQLNQPGYLAGQAAVQALNQLIGLRGQLRLENLQRQLFGEIEVYLSHLSLMNDEGIATLLGISIVRDGELTGAVRAVLDAINRPLQRLIEAAVGAAH